MMKGVMESSFHSVNEKDAVGFRTETNGLMQNTAFMFNKSLASKTPLRAAKGLYF